MNVSRVFTGIFMLVISLAFLGAGVWMQFYRLSGYEPVQARITKIETTTNHSTSNKHSKRSHTIYVEYVVDGQTYAGPSDVWESGMTEGQMITIYYNPDNPAQMGGETGWLGWLFIAIGGVAVLGSIGTMFSGRRE